LRPFSLDVFTVPNVTPVSFDASECVNSLHGSSVVGAALPVPAGVATVGAGVGDAAAVEAPAGVGPPWTLPPELLHAASDRASAAVTATIQIFLICLSFFY
jgi:hypothetical protein